MPTIERVTFPEHLREQIAQIVPSDIEWDVATGVGPASSVLQSLADQYDAEVIVVGTRQATLHGAAEEFFRGSVAAQLTHRQHKPVLVVPVQPTPQPEALPWEPTR
ncbi:universal stress protein [Amnibacterium kyonggiense]